MFENEFLDVRFVEKQDFIFSFEIQILKYTLSCYFLFLIFCRRSHSN